MTSGFGAGAAGVAAGTAGAAAGMPAIPAIGIAGRGYDSEISLVARLLGAGRSTACAGSEPIATTVAARTRTMWFISIGS